MFGTMQNVAVFFSDSPKRMAFLQDAIRESTPDSNRTKLRQHCQTRWIEQGDALVVFIELYDAVIQALEKVSISCDGKTGSSATELLAAVEIQVGASLESQSAEPIAEFTSISERSASSTEENQLFKEKINKLISMLEEGKDNKSQDIGMNKSIIECLGTKLSDALEESNESQGKQKKLSEQDKNLQAEKMKMKKQLEEFTSRSECIAKEKESFQEIKLEVEKLRRSAEHDRSSKLADFQEILKISESSKKVLEGELKSIKVKLLEKNKQNENNSRQLQDEVKKLEILETEFEVLRLENQQMTKTIEDLKKRFHDLEKFNQENIMKRDDLTKTMGRLSKEVAEKDNKVKLMVKSLNNKTTKSETKISELTKKVSDLEKDCNSESQENSERQASLRLHEVERLKRENAGLEEELKKTNYQSALRPSITFQKHFDLLSNEVAGHQHLISKLENSTRHLEVQMNEVKPMLGYLEEELQKQVAEKLCLRQDACLSEAEKANLLVKIGRLKQRVEAAEDSEDRLKVAFKEEMSIYKEKLREFQEAVEKSQKSEEHLNQLNRQTEEENKECQIRIVELEEVIRDLETENSKLRSSNDYLKKEMAKKEKILESVNLR